MLYVRYITYSRYNMYPSYFRQIVGRCHAGNVGPVILDRQSPHRHIQRTPRVSLERQAQSTAACTAPTWPSAPISPTEHDSITILGVSAGVRVSCRRAHGTQYPCSAAGVGSGNIGTLVTKAPEPSPPSYRLVHRTVRDSRTRASGRQSAIRARARSECERVGMRAAKVRF